MPYLFTHTHKYIPKFCRQVASKQKILQTTTILFIIYFIVKDSFLSFPNFFFHDKSLVCKYQQNKQSINISISHENYSHNV